MDMDEKCELASKIVDYIWYTHIYKKTLVPPHHTVEKVDANGDRCDYYVEEAQDIFNKVLDIIDDEEPEDDYAHCISCDKVINLDTDDFNINDNDTFCISCGEKE